MTEPITSPRLLKAHDRESQAFRLRLGAATYDEIGKALGVTRGAAYAMVRRVMDRTAKQSQESADELRQLELARLDQLYFRMSILAEKSSAGATDRCLRIMERRARLLGLDAPEKRDLTSDGKPIQIPTVIEVLRDKE